MAVPGVPTASQNAKAPTVQTVPIPPLGAEEEDHIILARITNDERPLRRVIKKFHNYISLSHPPIVPGSNGFPTASSVDDAREAFLVELATFQLSLKKSAMICEAEARQVDEYQRERKRIDNEHETLKGQIEELKIALEHAQMARRRKIEYDSVTEKVNTIPSREELEQTIQSLENDMAAIRAEHETQNRTLQGHKSALDGIIAELSSLRFMGKEQATTESLPATPAPEGLDAIVTDGFVEEVEISNSAGKVEESREGDEKQSLESVSDPAVGEGIVEDDIEMGEVEEDPREKGRKKLREELEEGEASDASSELSEPPDD